jgi:DNA replication protein DnaC
VITGKRTPDEEKAFKAACAEQLLHLGPAKERVHDPYTGKHLFITPTTQTCPEPTCIDGWAYNVDDGLIPCPVCGGQICSKCNDTGMYVPERHVDDPDFGKPEYCPRNCRAARTLQQERTAKLYAGARLPDGYQDCTLDTFRQMIRRDDDALKKLRLPPEEHKLHALWTGKALAYYAIEAFIANEGHAVDYAKIVAAARGQADPSVFSDVRNSLVLHGPHGVGKTGMVAAVVNALVPAGHVVRYTRTQDFVMAVQRRYNDKWRDSSVRDAFGDMESAEVIDAVKHAPLLILDEFDMPDADTPNKMGLIENVIRHRTGYLLPTLITTNLDAGGLEERWGTTTLSVLKQRCHFIAMGGQPLRAVPQSIPGVL